jgi:hypothetical protein
MLVLHSQLRSWVVAVALPLALSSARAAADDTPLVEDTPEAACNVLKQRMAELMALPHNRPNPRWFCDASTEKNEYLYIIGLRYDAPEPSKTAPLIGWFAVARRSTLVVEYDVAELRLVPISRGYSRAREHDKLPGQPGAARKR